MDSCDAGYVLGGIKNLQEKNKRLMLSACQDNSGPLVWFIYVCFGFFFYCTLNVFVCISTKLNLSTLPSFAPRLCWGVAIRWISAGFTTHSGRFCPEGTTSRWAPSFLIYTFNYAFFFFAPPFLFFFVLHHLRQNPAKNLVQSSEVVQPETLPAHVNTLSRMSVISSSWLHQRHWFFPLLLDITDANSTPWLMMESKT